MGDPSKFKGHIAASLLIVILSICYYSLDVSPIAFGAIATSSAAILAIVFSISILTIQIVVDKYNSTVLDYFMQNRLTQITLVLFLVSIVLSIVIAGMSNCSKIICTIAFALFLLCLYVFYQYFTMMLNIVDPQRLGKLLKTESISQINSDKLKELQETVASMGEIAIKSLQRKEILTTLVYAEYIEDILSDVIGTVPDRGKPKEITIDAIKALLKQYQQIADEAILREEDQVIVDISGRLFYSPIHQKGYQNRYINSEIFPIWLHVAEKTIEKRVPARIEITQDWLHFAVISSYGTFTSDDQYFKRYLDFLFEVNRTSIEKNDFDLFQKVVDHLSLSGIQSPTSAQRDLVDMLHMYDASTFIPDIHKDEGQYAEYSRRTRHLQQEVEFQLPKGFIDFSKFKEQLEDYREFISKYIGEGHADETNEASSSIATRFSKYIYNLRIHKLFFLIGGHLLYTQDKYETNYVKFIYELWYHTQPENVPSNQITLNETPVAFEPLWLTQLYIYGGVNSVAWTQRFFHYDGFNSISGYITRYYILCMSKCVELGRKIALPDLKGLEKYAADGDNLPLETWYRLLIDLNNEFKEIYSHIDALISDSSTYNSLFNSPADDVLKKTKEYFEELQQESENVIHVLEGVLPIDDQKRQEFIQGIISGYDRGNGIGSYINPQRYTESEHSSLSFFQISHRKLMPKSWFITISDRLVSGEFHLGRSIAAGEIQHLIETILNDDRIERQNTGRSGKTLYACIQQVTKSLSETGSPPDLIYIHDKLQNQLPKESLDRFSTQLAVDGRTLKLVKMSAESPFMDQVILLNSSAISWIYKPSPENGRLHVIVNEYEKDRSKYDLLVKTVAICKVVNADKIVVIQVGAPE